MTKSVLSHRHTGGTERARAYRSASVCACWLNKQISNESIPSYSNTILGGGGGGGGGRLRVCLNRI